MAYDPEYHRLWRLKHKEKLKAQKREWYLKGDNRERTCARLKANRSTLEGRARIALRNSKRQALQGKYTPILATVEQIVHLLSTQTTCQCCGREGTEKRKLCIDHDHITGAIRGMLCDGCNSIAQDKERVERVLQYIKNHDTQYFKEVA